MKKDLRDNIKVVDEKNFWILIGFFIVLLVLFPSKSNIILPVGLGIITFYYFVSFNTNCPKCNMPFAKRKIGEENTGQLYSSNEKDMDIRSSKFHIHTHHYICKYCGYDWDEEKRERSEN